MGRAAGFLALALLGVTPAVAWPGEFPTAMQTFEHVHALAFDATGHALWLGAHTGLCRTEDGGRTWAKIQVHGHGPDVMAIAAHPAEADVLYVGTHEAGVMKTAERRGSP